MTKEQETSGAICGGVISQTMNRKNMKKYGVWADAMSYVLPDAEYNYYVSLKKQCRNKEATEIFEKFAHGQI